MWDHRMAQTVEWDFKSLCGLPVPGLLPEQLREFTIEGLRAKRVRYFNAHASLTSLRARDGERVIAVDIGGDKLSASYFTVGGGAVKRAGDPLSCQADDGAGYLAALAALSERARREAVRVGISFAGPVRGTRLIAAPNLPGFLTEFRDGYGADFSRLFPAVQVANDAVAGLIAGAVEAVRPGDLRPLPDRRPAGPRPLRQLGPGHGACHPRHGPGIRAHRGSAPPGRGRARRDFLRSRLRRQNYRPSRGTRRCAEIPFYEGILG